MTKQTPFAKLAADAAKLGITLIKNNKSAYPYQFCKGSTPFWWASTLKETKEYLQSNMIIKHKGAFIVKENDRFYIYSNKDLKDENCVQECANLVRAIQWIEAQ